MTRAIALLGLAALLAGCGNFLAVDEPPPLPGERMPVLLLEPELQPDPRLAEIRIQLPPPVVNAAWPQSGGVASRSMQHLAAGDDLSLAWQRSIGTGSSRRARILQRPVVAAGKVFAADVSGAIVALAADDGRELWRYDPADDDYQSSSELGAGLAFENGWLFATLSGGMVVALNADTGAEVWRRKINLPLRSAPTVAGTTLLVLSADNQFLAYDAQDGEPLWQNAGYFETAAMLGGASAAYDGGIAVAPFSSGEVYAIRTDTGQPIWADTIQRPRLAYAMAAINDIQGDPVIDRDVVYVAGQGGEMVAFDLRRGTRLWEQEMVSVETPWAVGDYVYVLTSRGEVACLLRQGGRIKWVSPLPRLTDPEDTASAPIVWSGPVLAGDRLLFAGSHGKAVSMSPYTGELLGEIDLPGPVVSAPVVADRTVYFLTTGGDIVAYR
ncbi:outer membrane protein assembly factor BamB family protein [Marinivivus vitaminiproducens]|uniref:outer membrane protein assembly factor BamB family protein n=1 Tax=Marinivivus vitaminiproducens TaxID=3035935 RepID=UPI0027A9E76B|nr:PQQ-binding-like beta-propeller repeat protein [Geminicoccaceae bacterium SCSIO 64248]